MELRKSDRAYFKVASAVSELSEFKQHKIGAVAVYKHKIVSSGCNSYVSKHAELECLLPLMRRKDIDFSRVSLYISRRHKSGELALAAPCPSCRALIKSLGIRNIYYTGDQSYISEEIVY